MVQGSRLVMDLGWVDFDLDAPPSASWLGAYPLLPRYSLAHAELSRERNISDPS